MKEIINEHEVTKKMIDTLRSMSNINEAEEGNDVITLESNSDTYMAELKKISDTVDGRVQIKKFKIYPKDRDVQIDGRFDFGVDFYMSTKAGKLSISITEDSGRPKQMFIDKEMAGIINTLVGYYENWRDEWTYKLNTEYKQK